MALHFTPEEFAERRRRALSEGSPGHHPSRRLHGGYSGRPSGTFDLTFCRPMILLIALLVAAPAPAQLLWRAELDSTTVWLLGTVHFGKPSLYPLPPPVETAFRDAQVLIVELDISRVEPARMASLVTARGIYSDGSNLQDHISPATWQALEERTAALGLPSALVAHQKPWLAALSLTTMAVRQAGYSDAHGVERHLLGRAGDRTVVELETLEGQLALFTDLSEDQQERFLASTLEQLVNGRDHADAILDAWRRGDAAALDRLLNEQRNGQAIDRHLHQTIVVGRNQSMAEQIAKLARPGQIYLVAVGAAHLVGEQGLVELLRERGFQIWDAMESH